MPVQEGAREVFGVSEALERVQTALEDLGPLWMEGEVFEYRGAHRSGHYYFKLRDEKSVVEAKLWAGVARRALKCRLEEGRAVLVRGRFDVYPPRGNLSFLLEQVEDRGAGDLARRFEELKRRLEREGLFDPAARRPLPVRPRTVVFISGHPSAASADVLRTLAEHAAPLSVWMRPARVQGEGSAADLAAALAEAGRSGADVVLMARGGGSLEDLWSFNEEAVVRAVRACPVPVLCAVGHETDFTLCDFAADARAKTPTAGALRLVEGWMDARIRLAGLGSGLEAAARAVLGGCALRLDQAARNLRGQKPDARLARMRARVGEAHHRLLGAAEQAVGSARSRLLRFSRRLAGATPGHAAARLRERLTGAGGRLRAGSPLALLGRGYALVEHRDRPGFLRRAAEAARGDPLRVRLAEGSLDVRVEAVHPRAARTGGAGADSGRQ